MSICWVPSTCLSSSVPRRSSLESVCKEAPSVRLRFERVEVICNRKDPAVIQEMVEMDLKRRGEAIRWAITEIDTERKCYFVDVVFTRQNQSN